ncbi:MAG: hypothetical protein VW274_10760, partial [Thalassolituus sp.]
MTPVQGFESVHGTLVNRQGWLVYGDEQLASCNQLLSAVENADFILVACDQNWHLFTTQLQLIESFNPELVG